MIETRVRERVCASVCVSQSHLFPHQTLLSESASCFLYEMFRENILLYYHDLFTSEYHLKRQRTYFCRSRLKFMRNIDIPRSHTAEYRPLISKSHVHSIGHFLMLLVWGKTKIAITAMIRNEFLIMFLFIRHHRHIVSMHTYENEGKKKKKKFNGNGFITIS
jgi:hypothetical protein